MKALEKRIVTLEGCRKGPPTSLDHVTDHDLDELERLCAKSILDYAANDVAFFQRYGFLPSFDMKSGTVRDWLTPEEVAYMESKGA